MLARIARPIAKISTNQVGQSVRCLSSNASSTMLSRPKKQNLQLTQHREFLFEIGCTTAFVGLYHLVSEKSSDAAQKPHYYQPYECGFNLLGGVLFAGYTFLIWIFLPEIIMLMLTPTFDVAMPMFLGFLFATWTWIWVIPTTTNI